MRLHVLALAAAALVLPCAAFAQTGGSGEPSDAHDMKGPPNASGYGKDTGMAKGGTVVGGEGGSGSSSGKAMKGSPNADGYGK